MQSQFGDVLVDAPRRTVEAPTRAATRGVTLIELMIALSVLGLLAALAYPSFVSHLNRGRVAAAIAGIRNIEMSLERIYTNTGRYPDDLQALGSPVDPWGSPYRYLSMESANVGQVRKDRSLHPLNTDYDLYSMGADRTSSTPLTAHASQDDIVRARNGGFVGLAADF